MEWSRLGQTVCWSRWTKRWLGVDPNKQGREKSKENIVSCVRPQMTLFFNKWTYKLGFYTGVSLKRFQITLHCFSFKIIPFYNHICFLLSLYRVNQNIRSVVGFRWHKGRLVLTTLPKYRFWLYSDRYHVWLSFFFNVKIEFFKYKMILRSKPSDDNLFHDWKRFSGHVCCV